MTMLRFLKFSLIFIFFFPNELVAAKKKFDDCMVSRDVQKKLRDCNRLLRRKLSRGYRTSVYRGRAEAYTKLGEFEKALADINKSIAIELRSTNISWRGDIYEKLGQMELARKDWFRAIALYEKDLEKYPQGPLYNYFMAEVLLKVGQASRALSHLDISIRKSPNYAPFRYRRAQAYEKLDLLNDAIKDMDRAAKLKPAETQYSDALAALRQKKEEKFSLKQKKKNVELEREVLANLKKHQQTKIKPPAETPDELAQKRIMNKRVGNRLAIIIGNDNYQNLPSYYQLQKARNDARSTAKTFSELGFEVVSGFDIKRRNMNVMLTKFANKIAPGDEVMFFFAGHGVRIDGLNYLLPSDIPEISDVNEDLLKSETIRVDEISDMFRKKGARLSLLVIDACRNNPYKDNRGRSIGGTRGLAPMDPPEGTLVLFSAGAGQEALDRLSDNDKNPNSIFTRTFLPMVKQEGLELSRLSRLVKGKVRDLAKSVGHKQTPAVYNEVIGDVYLAQ
jgi:tetratricopeptide (TPR) repeat protein